MTINKDKIIGVILAGGLSKRMKGGNKFLKELNGKPIIELVKNKASKQVTKLIINANVQSAKLKKFKLTIVKDTVKGFRGPLAGILSAMEFVEKKKIKWLATFPCDAPFFPINLVEKLINKARQRKCKIVFAESNKISHPVFGVWDVSLKKSLIKTLIDEDKKKMELFIKKHPYSKVNFPFSDLDPFFNINNKEEFDIAKKYVKQLNLYN
ncbi:MAG: Molybdenum cofactor guanylyltransferase [Alphaproteobacteria bacterium MarineAlpha6_Bin3]|nr:MAG: Molybdenum cofactor guanylyltransferase [Alphaproteobacteria bacterium MarineAlpha6_Bin3]|tara:strand:- start:141 stop:770 length:630 start_codon:yes stop_codon:yes gene_type:complete